MKDEVDVTTFLVLRRSNRHPYVTVDRSSSKQPKLAAGERAVRIVIKVAKVFFEPQGVPTATIRITEDMLTEPVPEVTVQPPEGYGNG